MNLRGTDRSQWLLIGGGALAVVALVIVVVLVASRGGEGDDGEAAASASETSTASATAAGLATGSAAPTEAAAPLIGAVRYIGDTGGDGVSLRTACQDDARAPGAWPDGVEVSVLQVGADECEGWLVVRAEGTASWVREEYVVAAPDGGGAASAGTPGPTSQATPGGTATPPAVAASVPAPISTPTPTPSLASAQFTTLAGQPLNVSVLAELAMLQGGESGFEFLGRVSRSRTANQSVCNASGPYGGTNGAFSVRNPDSLYGRGPGGDPADATYDSEFSAYNPGAHSPPKIIMDGQVVGLLTIDSGGGHLHPDVLFAVLGC